MKVDYYLGKLFFEYRRISWTQREYKEVEKIAGNCKCGGQYQFNAPSRCPICKSANIVRDPNGRIICYD